jgi:outer membrane beta-barrel protein
VVLWLFAGALCLPSAGLAESSAVEDSVTTLPSADAHKPAGAQANAPWVLSERMIKLGRERMNVIRSGPGERYAVTRVVPEGSTFLVLAKKDEWYNVQLSETETGWVHESLCEEYGDMSNLEFRPNPRLFSRIGSFTATTYGGGYSFDRKSNSLALGGRLGYYVFDFVQLEGGVSWTHVNRPAEIVESLFDIRLEEESFHVLFYEMNANVEFLPGRQLVPYGTIGLGSSILRGETESSLNYGAGIFFYVKKRLACRWEFRNYRFESGSDDARRTNNNFAFNVGTTFLL